MRGGRQLQHIAQQPVIVGAVLNTADKAAVDFDLINIQILQITEAGVACTEIIHRDLNPRLLPPVEQLVEVGIVLQLHTLGDLQGKGVPRQAALLQQLQHLMGNFAVAELRIGDIDADMHLRQLFAPLPALGQRRLEHPQAHGMDHAGLLQHRDKLYWAHRPPGGGLIAQQRLRPEQVVAAGVYLGLIAQRKAGKIVLDALAELFLELHVGELFLIVLLGEEGQGVFSLPLGLVQRLLHILIEGAAIHILVPVVGDHAGGNGAILRHAGVDLLVELLHLLLLQLGQVDGKAVPVHPVGPQTGPHHLFQNLRDPAEDLAAVFPAMADVDVLEVVHPHQQQIARDTRIQDALHVLSQLDAVKGAGELVHLALQHGVRHPADQGNRLAVGIPLAPALTGHPYPIIFLIHQPVRHVAYIDLALQHLLQMLLQARQILFIHHGAPVLYGAERGSILQNGVALADVGRQKQASCLKVPEQQIVVAALPQDVQHLQLGLYRLFSSWFQWQSPLSDGSKTQSPHGGDSGTQRVKNRVKFSPDFVHA